MFADVTAVTAGCDCCKTRRKDAGGVWGQGGQVWDDYRVSIHVISTPIPRDICTIFHPHSMGVKSGVLPTEKPFSGWTICTLYNQLEHRPQTMEYQFMDPVLMITYH